jgi:hypothetical protein
MFLKKKVLTRLNEFEDKPSTSSLLGTKRSDGISRRDFIFWFLKEDSKNFTYDIISKCIDDCIEDEYINQGFVDGELRPKLKINNSYNVVALESMGYEHEQIENILLSSRGRELTHWYFFLPAVLERLSIKEIIVFAIITAITIMLGILGFNKYL